MKDKYKIDSQRVSEAIDAVKETYVDSMLNPTSETTDGEAKIYYNHLVIKLNGVVGIDKVSAFLDSEGHSYETNEFAKEFIIKLAEIL